MKSDSRTHPDRMDTRLAKRAEREKLADEVWAEVSQQEQKRDDKIERLKAARLARDAAKPPTGE